MINLLPKFSQKRIQRLYQIRLGIMILILCAFTLVAALALLAPSYVVTLTRENSALDRKAELDAQVSAKQGGVAAETLTSVNKTLALIASYRQKVSVPEVIEAILSVRTSAITIDSISFERTKDKGTVLLTGVALTRETLLQFTQELKRLPTLSEVTLPVSNLAEAKNNRFSITALLTEAATSTPIQP